jgi:hypothetical protein
MSTELSNNESTTPINLGASNGIVHAPINYLAPMIEKPYSYTYAPPDGTPSTNRKMEAHTVAVIDGAKPPSLRRSTGRVSSCIGSPAALWISTMMTKFGGSIIPNANGC